MIIAQTVSYFFTLICFKEVAHMKRMLLACLVSSSMMIISGCAGGGGGGGEYLNPRPTFSVSDISDGLTEQGAVAEDYSNAGTALQNIFSQQSSDIDLSGYDNDGSKISIEHGNSIDVFFNNNLLSEFKTGENGDVNIYSDTSGNSELIAFKDMSPETLQEWKQIEPELPSPGDTATTNPNEDGWIVIDEGFKGDKSNPVYFKGTVFPYKEFLILNAGLDLEYSSFGGWGYAVEATGDFKHKGGTYSNIDYAAIGYLPVSGGMNDKLAAPEANAEFHGKAVAMAEMKNPDGISSPYQEFYRGDVTLTVENANGHLEMRFPNFYDISFELAIDGTGFTAKPGLTPTIQSRADTNSNIKLTQDIISPVEDGKSPHGSKYTYMNGNFYGDTVATESVGRFNVKADNNINVTGSFGGVTK